MEESAQEKLLQDLKGRMMGLRSELFAVRDRLQRTKAEYESALWAYETLMKAHAPHQA